MFPFWEDVIAPVVEAVRARRVVEIGALRGETTVRMLERLGPDCELHVIDPVPQFDPTEHEAAFPGRYRFHLGTSHEVLPELPPADVALVDGDHNWFTVYHELKMLAHTAGTADRALPVLVLHDVAWPYGRRDLYYEPSRIPEEHRQPHLKAGMRPGTSRLFRTGGMNLGLDNADHEGGPRNGVMTALDDFVAEHPEPLRVVVLPIYYGLAIVADHRTLDAHPELVAILDRVESHEGQVDLVALGERIRLDEAIFGQAWIRTLEGQVERASDRYLDLVQAALNSAQPAEARIGGERLAQLREGLHAVRAGGVAGDLVQVGADTRGAATFMQAFLDVHELSDRAVWHLGGSEAVPVPVGPLAEAAARVRSVSGDVAEVLSAAPIDAIALLDLGDLESADHRGVLERVRPRLSPGAQVVASGRAVATG